MSESWFQPGKNRTEQANAFEIVRFTGATTSSSGRFSPASTRFCVISGVVRCAGYAGKRTLHDVGHEVGDLSSVPSAIALRNGAHVESGRPEVLRIVFLDVPELVDDVGAMAAGGILAFLPSFEHAAG